MTKTTRLTLDIAEENHKILKMFCAESGVSMKDFVLDATFEKLEQLCEELERNSD